MAKRKNDKPGQRKNNKNKDLQALYAKARRQFTAADLQKYTVIEKGIPLERVIADMEKIQKNYKPKKA
jgi:hypothetical protein